MDRKPRILFLAPLPPPVHGSAVVSEQIRSSKLIREHFGCDFVNISTSHSTSEVGKGGVCLGFLKLGRFVGSFMKCLWMLLTRKYDLCYCALTCHGQGFLKDAPFVFLCKLFRRKVVLHQHNKGMSRCLDKWPYRWLIPYAYKGCKVILLSWRLYSDIERVVAKEDVMVCPNGSAQIQKPSKTVNDIPRLLFLSNLIVSKGVYVLLDACKILVDRGVAFTCDFVGGESKEISRDVFEAAVHVRGLDDKIVYHGSKYGADKERFWNQADIFVFPTFYSNECFPLVILEAMQHSLPVVSTNEGGIPDIVRNKETGIIVESQDAVMLADKLEILLKDKNYCIALGSRGYEVYKEEYTIEAFESCLLKCLSQSM